MLELGSSGSVRGVLSNEHPYRHPWSSCRVCRTVGERALPPSVVSTSNGRPSAWRCHANLNLRREVRKSHLGLMLPSRLATSGTRRL